MHQQNSTNNINNNHNNNIDNQSSSKDYRHDQQEHHHHQRQQRQHEHEHENQDHHQRREPDEISPGVRRIAEITATFDKKTKAYLILAIFLVAFVYSLDFNVRITYQTEATNSYSSHSLLAAVNVLRAVISTAAQPTFAKIADVFGRLEVVLISMFFYSLGTIVESFSVNVQQFAGGAILFQIGYTAIVIIVEILIADITSLRYRLFFALIPTTPFLFNTWISGYVTSLVQPWQIGIFIWAIIFPLSCCPLVYILVRASFRAKKGYRVSSTTTSSSSSSSSSSTSSETSSLSESSPLIRGNSISDDECVDNDNHHETYHSPQDSSSSLSAQKSFSDRITILFWQLDAIGVLLVVSVFTLLLVPLTLAGGLSEQWKKSSVIVPLILGVCLLPIFVFWERKAKYPLMPLHLIHDKGIWAGIIIGFTLDFIWYLQGDYLYTVLVVAFDMSIKAATITNQIFGFASVLTGTLLGLVVSRVRRVKKFIIFGIFIWLISLSLLIRFRGGSGANAQAGVIIGQFLLGFGAGNFSYPILVSLQASSRHEHVAIITALYFAFYNLGGAAGASVSGGIWTNILPNTLMDKLDNNSTLASFAYESPLDFASQYPMSTPERIQVVEAYKHVQRILVGTALAFASILIVCVFLLHDPYLGKKQSHNSNQGNNNNNNNNQHSSTLNRRRVPSLNPLV